MSKEQVDDWLGRVGLLRGKTERLTYASGACHG